MDASELKKQKARERVRAWRLANPERAKESSKKGRANKPEKYRALHLAWRIRNAERLRQRSAAWRLNNRGKYLEQMARWVSKNPERRREIANNWRKNNQDKVNAVLARRRASQLKATPAWANEFFISEAYHLAKLRTKLTGYSWHVDHIVPLQHPLVCGLHVEHNLRVIPGRINQSKNNRHWPDMP